MSWFDAVAEERIREALERGAFDDLPGRGRPLELADLERVPEELRAAYSILRNAGVLPEELELRKELVSLQRLLAACRDDDEARSLRARIVATELRSRLLDERRLRRG